MNGQLTQPDIRDEIIDFIPFWSRKTEIKALHLADWIGITSSKFYHWKSRYGKVNEDNGTVLPHDHWLEEWERKAILDFWLNYPLERYQRCTYMMIDQNLVVASPISVQRVLAKAGLIRHLAKEKSKKGEGFEQPLAPHEHWHVDISYLKIKGTFYYLRSVLDGSIRYIVHHEIRESMIEVYFEIVLKRGKQKYPEARARIISDNGLQFMANDFKEFIRLSGMTHFRTYEYYPQSHGKLELWHKTLKRECV